MTSARASSSVGLPRESRILAARVNTGGRRRFEEVLREKKAGDWFRADRRTFDGGAIQLQQRFQQRGHLAERPTRTSARRSAPCPDRGRVSMKMPAMPTATAARAKHRHRIRAGRRTCRRCRRAAAPSASRRTRPDSRSRASPRGCACRKRGCCSRSWRRALANHDLRRCRSP